MNQHDFTDPLTFAGLTGLLFLVVVFRYVFIAGAFYIAFYIFNPKGYDRRRIRLVSIYLHTFCRCRFSYSSTLAKGLHRWMHRPKVYRLIHKVHHDSHITSPWTSFSFHPGEGVLQSIVIPIIVLFLPMHYWTIVFLLTFMTLTSAINHSNIEVYPKGFYKHWLGRWFIGATHHSLHHTQYRSNFGLYFTFWDKWMKTESEKYASNFEKHTS